MQWEDILAWVGSVLYLVRLLPQPIRIYKTKKIQGVSALAIANGAIATAAWFVHGVIHQHVPVWVASVISFPIEVFTLLLLRKNFSKNDGFIAGLWILTILTGIYFYGKPGLGFLLSIGIFVNNGPQVLAAIRGKNLEGISTATWWIAFVDAALWGVYGIFVHDIALVGYGCTLATAGTIILIRVRHYRRRNEMHLAEIARLAR